MDSQYVAPGTGELIRHMKSLDETPKVPMRVTPSVFTVSVSEDVRSWLENLEVVFISRGVGTLNDKLRWVRGYIDSSAARFFETLPLVNTWDEFKQHWLRKYTLWGTDLKYRRHFYQVKQETEDV